MIGTVLAARAPADGYTLLLGTGTTFAVNPHTQKNLPYDPVRDFAPISLLATQPYVLALNPAVAAQSVLDLIKLAKAKPGALNYGSPGTGSSGNLAGALFNHVTGVDITHVHYRGNGPAISAIIGREIALLFSTIPAIVPHVKSGRLRGLATTGTKRSAALPAVPTAIESGLPEFLAGTWYGAVAPAKTPPKVIAIVNQAIVKALAHPTVGERIERQGAQPEGTSAADFATFISYEIAKYAKIIAIAGIKPE